MSITKEEKKKVIAEHQRTETDTGSVEVQVAVLTTRIKNLTKHLEAHKQDKLSRHGLFKLVGQRKNLLNYLKNKDEKRYEALIKKLGLRK